MLIAARESFAARRKTARDYVQNGLVAMWDGIENAGWGVHNASATTWKDLIGSRDASVVNGGGFDGNSLTNSSTANTPAWFSSSLSAANCRTVEAVILPQSIAAGRQGVVCASGTAMAAADKTGSSHEGLYGVVVASGGLVVYFGNSYVYEIPFGKAVACTYCYANKAAYLDGAAAVATSATSYVTYSFGNRSRVPSIGGFAPNASSNNVFTGHIYRIAYYSRTLTAAEIAANYAIDKVRFNLP